MPSRTEGEALVFPSQTPSSRVSTTTLGHVATVLLFPRLTKIPILLAIFDIPGRELIMSIYEKTEGGENLLTIYPKICESGTDRRDSGVNLGA